MVEVGLQDDRCRVHVYIALISRVASAASQTLGCLDCAECLVPEDDRFAGFLPQLFCQPPELVLAGVALRASGDSHDDGIRLDLLSDLRDAVHHLLVIPDDGVRRGQDP